jgi:hypothetical protein
VYWEQQQQQQVAAAVTDFAIDHSKKGTKDLIAIIILTSLLSHPLAEGGSTYTY